MNTASTGDLVSLEGSPAEIGAVLGRLNGKTITEEVQKYFEHVRKQEGFDLAAMVRASRHYHELVGKFAPHWKEETGAIATAAGLDPEVYLTYRGAIYRNINRPECFSFCSAPAWNAVNATLLHKNRDSARTPQCAYLLGTAVKGRRILRYLATSNVSSMGPSMVLNEKGLAAVADMGHPDPKPRQRGMMNPDLLRLIAENAATVEEAFTLLQDLHRQGVYAGGKFSTYWLFADQSGQGLRVYQFHDQPLVRKEMTEGWLMTRDSEPSGVQVRGEFLQNRGRISTRLLNAISRQSPVLQHNNISAGTAVIPPTDADLFSYFQFAVHYTGKTLYVPLYMGITAVPRVVADGTLYFLSDTQPFGTELFEKSRQQGNDLVGFEENLDAERAEMELHARRTLAESGRSAAREILTHGCLELARKVEQQLRGISASSNFIADL